MGYYLVLRRNGSACGCLGPYASASVARAEADALPRTNPRGGVECVVVRANGFRDAMRARRSNPAGVEPLPARLPRSTVVQTLLFDASMFNVGQAKSWAKRHGFKYGKVDTGGGRATMIRLRQVDPDAITAGSFRTIRFTDGIEAVIGMPKRGAKRNPARTELVAATLAPELVAAHAAAGLAMRGVKAAGRSVSGLASDAGTAFADIVAPRKRRANGGLPSAVIQHTLREPEEDQRDYIVTVKLERIGSVGLPRTFVNAEITAHEAGFPPNTVFDGNAVGVPAALNALGRLHGGAKRTRFRKKIEREVAAAREKLLAGAR